MVIDIWCSHLLECFVSGLVSSLMWRHIASVWSLMLCLVTIVKWCHQVFGCGHSVIGFWSLYLGVVSVIVLSTFLGNL